MPMFSTDQHLQKLERARRQFVPGNDFLLDRVVEDMVERLGAVQRTFDHGIALLSRNSFALKYAPPRTVSPLAQPS